MKKLVVLLLLLSVCVYAEFPVTITDDVGLVSKIEKTPVRIVSLGPSNTEILFALGLGERTVGVTSYCDFPAEAKKKKKVGDFISPNLEIILSLKPDLVLCAGGVQKDLALKLRGLNIPAVTLYPKDLNQLINDIAVVGRTTGAESKAAKYMESLRARIAAVKEKVKGQPKPSVYFEIWNSPLTSAGKSSFVDELITLAGGENIFAKVDQTFPTVNAENIVKSDPDIIVTAYMDRAGKIKTEVVKRAGWGKLKAIKNDRIYDDIDSNILLRAGPRLVDGIEALARKFHPELYK